MNDQPNKILDNPKDFICTHCKTPMQKRISTGGDGALRKGLILVCSSCGRPNVLGDSGLHPLSKEEFLALDPQTKRILLMSAQGIKQLVESGGTWQPKQN